MMMPKLRSILILSALKQTATAAAISCSNLQSNAPQTCVDNTAYTVSGTTFVSHCGVLPDDNSLIGPFQFSTVQQCLNYCVTYNGCTATAINSDGCYVVQGSVQGYSSEFSGFDTYTPTNVCASAVTTTSTSTTSSTTSSSSTSSSTTSSTTPSTTLTFTTSTTSSTNAVSTLGACSAYPSALPLFVCINNPYYTVNQVVYQLQCTNIIMGTPYAQTSAPGLAACISLCTPANGCTGVTSDPATGMCSLYNGNVVTGAKSSPTDYSASALLVGQCYNPPIVSSSTTTSSTTTSSTTTSSTTTSSTTTSSTTTSSTTTSSTTSSTTTSSTSSTTTTSTISSASTPPVLGSCSSYPSSPNSNWPEGSYYTNNQVVYKITAQQKITNTPYNSQAIPQVSTAVADCIALCAQQTQCDGVNYKVLGNQCYFFSGTLVLGSQATLDYIVVAIEVGTCTNAASSTSVTISTTTSSTTSTSTLTTSSTSTSSTTRSTTSSRASTTSSSTSTQTTTFSRRPLRTATVSLTTSTTTSATPTSSPCSARYSTLLGFPTSNSGCYPLTYSSTFDLGSTNPSDAQQRCQQKCIDLGASCGSVVVQLNKAADSDLYTGTCFLFAPGSQPPGPRRCANGAYQLLGYAKASSGSNVCS